MPKLPSYIELRRRKYWFKRRTPKTLEQHPEFGDKAFIAKSLQTDSLSQAIKLRDLLNAEIERAIRGDRLGEFNSYYNMWRAKFGNPFTIQEHNKSDILRDADYELGELISNYEFNSTNEQGKYERVWDDEGISTDQEIQSLLKLISDIKGEHYIQPISLKESLEQALKEKNVSKSTLDAYKNSVRHFLNNLEIEDIPISNINKQLVSEFISYLFDKNKTTKTVNNLLGNLSAIFEFTSNKGQISTPNPFRGFRISTKPTNRRQPYSKTEVEQLIKAIHPQFKLALEVLYYTGMRMGELLKLDNSSIVEREGSSKTVSCFSIAPEGDGKTESATRFIPIHSDLLPKLSGFEGFKYSYSHFNNNRRDTAIQLWGNSFVNTHDNHSLRHTFTTVVTSYIENENLVKWLVGHSRGDGSVTFRNYFHGYDLERLQDAVELIPRLELTS
jgi:integrase